MHYLTPPHPPHRPPTPQIKSYFYPSNVDRRVARLLMTRNFSNIRWLNDSTSHLVT
jgi:hypothetical protein